MYADRRTAQRCNRQCKDCKEGLVVSAKGKVLSIPVLVGPFDAVILWSLEYFDLERTH